MAKFTVKDWSDAPSTATPISAAALEDMETRLSDHAAGMGVQALPTSRPTEAVLYPQFERVTVDAPLADQTLVNGDLYIPNLLKVPEGVGTVYPGEPYRIYHSTDHDPGAGGIFLLTAPEITGPYTDRGLIYQDTTSGNQTETPWIMYNETESLFFLYHQQNGVAGTKSSQVTVLATSPNGVDNWTRYGVVLDWPGNAVDSAGGTAGLHNGYARIMRDLGLWFTWTLWFGGDYGEYAMWWSMDGRDWIMDGRSYGHSNHLTGDNERRVSWNGAQVVYWKSRRLIHLAYTDYVSGTTGSPTESYMMPLSENLRKPLGNGMRVFSATGASPWEGATPAANVSSLYSENGKLYGLYKSGNGRLGLAVSTT